MRTLGPAISRRSSKTYRQPGAESPSTIAKGLNDAGIPTTRGPGGWSAFQVQRVLGRL